MYQLTRLHLTDTQFLSVHKQTRLFVNMFSIRWRPSCWPGWGGFNVSSRWKLQPKLPSAAPTRPASTDSAPRELSSPRLRRLPRKSWQSNPAKIQSKEGQSLNGSYVKHYIISGPRRYPSSEEGWQEWRSARWRDNVLMGTAEGNSRADIDPSYLIALRQTENIWGHQREQKPILNLFLLLREKTVRSV